MQILPNEMLLLADNLLLPEYIRASAVLLSFGQPVSRALMGDFLRIQLSEQMLAGGEDGFYLANVSQPHRVKPKACPTCRRLMHQERPGIWRCMARDCRMHNGRPSREVSIDSGPMRGVVKLMIADDFIHHTESRTVGDKVQTVEYLSRVILLLDRRYRPEVLAAVKRTAHMICEQRGWQLV